MPRPPGVALVLMLSAALLTSPVYPQRPVARPAPQRVFRYLPNALAPRHLSIDLARAIAIGGAEAVGPSEFKQVSDVVVLGNGSIALGLLQEAEIRVFDSAGGYLRTLGRSGRGPGEWLNVWQVLRRADSLVGVDGFGVGQVFTARGQYVRMNPRPVASGLAVHLVGYLPTGRLLGYYFRQPDQGGVGTTTGNATVVAIDGTTSTVIGTFPSHDIVRRRSGDPSPLVLGPRAQIVVAGNGYCVSSNTAAYTVKCFEPGGAERFRLVRPGWATKMVTEGDKLSYFATLDSANPGPQNAAYRAEARHTLTFATRLPAVGRLVGSATGDLWVGPPSTRDATMALNPLPTDPTRWSIFGPSGVWFADATLPTGFRLLAVGKDRVVGLTQDAEGAERVLVAPLVPTPRRTSVP